MSVKFKRANGKYQPGDTATFMPRIETELVKQGYAEQVVLPKEEPMPEKKTPEPAKNPDKPLTRQTTVGPQKR